MGTFDIPIPHIDAALLNRLVADEVAEGRQLEYKEQLPGDKPEHKREFLADVTSFANSAGGDLIYGIRERRDADQTPTGEPEALIGLNGVNLDAEELRLQNLLRDGVQPRMVGLVFHRVVGPSSDPCLVVRVPRSWAAPHMVSSNGRFYGRTSNGKYPLDVGEIRAAFLASEEAQDRVRRFRIQRVMRILAGESPIPIDPGLEARVILHALPTSPSESSWAQVKTLSDPQLGDLISPLGARANSWHFNLDGFVTYAGSRTSERYCYAQLFRNGGVESLAGHLIFGNASDKTFYGPTVEEALIQNLGMCQKLWKHIGTEPPIAIGIALTGVKGVGIRPTVDSWVFPHDLHPFDRDPIIVPEVLVEDTTTPPDVMLKPVLDMLWNAGGWNGSPNYPGGRWTRPHR